MRIFVLMRASGFITVLMIFFLTGCGGGDDTFAVTTTERGLVVSRAVADSYDSVANAALRVDAEEGVLSNDHPGSVVVDQTITSELGATVDLDPDGSFEYHPPANLTDTAAEGETVVDSFRYKLSSGQSAQVTVNLPYKVLFVDVLARSGGNGTEVRPFRQISEAVDKARKGDVIYLVYNETEPHRYTGSVPPGVKLVGEGVWFEAGDLELPFRSPSRVVGEITVRGNNELSGLRLDNPGGVTVRGQGASELVFRDNVFVGMSKGIWLSESTDVEIVGNNFVPAPSGGGIAVAVDTTQDCAIVYNRNRATANSRQESLDGTLVIAAKGNLRLDVEASGNQTIASNVSLLEVRAENGVRLTAVAKDNKMWYGYAGIYILCKGQAKPAGQSIVRIEGNDYQGSTLAILQAYGVAGLAHEWTITDNSAVSDNDGLWLTAMDHVRVNATVTGNTLVSSSTRDLFWEDQGGIFVEARGTGEIHQTISKNTISKFFYGLRLDINGPDIAETVIEDNISDCLFWVRQITTGLSKLVARNNRIDSIFQVFGLTADELDVSGQLTPPIQNS